MQNFIFKRHLASQLWQGKVLMVFLQRYHLYFFAATIVDKIFDNHFIFKVSKIFLTDIMKHTLKMVPGKTPPGKKTPDAKLNTIPNLILTPTLTPHGGLFSGRIFY